MALTERLQIIVTADGKGAAREFQQIGATAERELGRTEDRIKKLSSGLVSSGSQIALAGGIATAGVFKLAQAAGDYEEAASAASVVFGEASESVEQFGRDAIKSAGLSRRAAVDAAVTFGTFGKAAGLTGEELATFSTDLTQLAGDLASFRNTTTDEAITAIGAALRGESEPIRRYGVLLDDATLKQEALELGIYDGVGALTQQQKVLAAQAAIFEQTTDAQGDAVRTSDSLANQTRSLSAQFENLQIALGEGAVPVFSDLLELTNGALERFQGLSPETQNLVGRFGALAAVGVTVVGGLSVLAGGALRLVDTLGDLRTRTRDAEGSLTRFGTVASTTGKIVGGAAAAGGVLLLADAVVSLTRDTNLAKQAYDDFTVAVQGNNTDRALSRLNTIGEGFKDLGDILLEPVLRGQDDLVFNAAGQLVADLGNVDRAINDFVKNDKLDEARAALNLLNEVKGLPENERSLANINALLERYGGFLDSAAAASGGATGTFKDLGPLFGGVARETEDATDATEDLANQLDTAAAEAELFAAILGNAEARVEGFDRAIANSTALDDYLSAGLKLNESLDTLRNTVGQLPADIDATGIAFADLSEEGVDALNNLLGLGDAIQSSLQTALQFGSPDQVREQADTIRAELRKVFESVGITGSRFNEYLEILGLTPRQIDTAITVSGEAEALAKIEVFRDGAELLAAPIELQVAVLEAQLAGDLTSASNLIDAWFIDKQDGLIDNPFLIALGLGPTAEVEQDLDEFRREQEKRPVVLKVDLGLTPEQIALFNQPPAKQGGRSNTLGRPQGRGARPPLDLNLPVLRSAAGGPVESGQTYMVNEAGPEMFRPATDGFIMNAASTERLIRGVEALVTGGGGDTINIYETSGPRQTAEELIRAKSASRFLAGVA